jgi:hypothetical protein
MKRISSHSQPLVKVIRKFFPSQFFSHIKVSRRTTLWLPQRIAFFAMLMMWDAEKNLQDRFAAARDLFRALFPKWRLGTDYFLS